MAVDGGWTHVKRKSRRNAPSPSKTATTTHLPPDTFAPRTTGVLRPPEALRTDYDRIHTQWLESPVHQALIKLVDDHAKGLRISKVVCLGIGTFDPDDGAWEAKRAAYVQLCALSTLISQLHSDKSFLAALGYRVVASPTAYELIDDATLLFAVHLYRPIYAAALKSSLPAIFVGTGVTMEKPSDLENMKKMDKTYTRHAFPQDTASTAFSSTSIYFKPPPESTSPDGRRSSLEASPNNNTDKPAQESSCKDITSKKNGTAHVPAALSANRAKARDETKIPDECADDKVGDGMPDEAEGPRLQGTTVKDKPNKEQDTPSEE
ncbi:hypothetical protein LEL_10489 [Akanthomyces lecanii RCEF 1005]|uniref:SRR1-like domain-containing protein n=1 Tax=Akanthomyces lecanii RCEF 1005 TaxID=1081108 RepID=A0A162MSS4_CORDF|nr:hypothetical protein LEL_10489 [Akanthomyces lecanii RCEF 1005]